MFREAISNNKIHSYYNFDFKNDYYSTRLPPLFPIERQKISSSALSTFAYSYYDDRLSSNTDIKHIKSSRSKRFSRSIISPPNVGLSFLNT